jgi:hypothetical protein
LAETTSRLFGGSGLPGDDTQVTDDDAPTAHDAIDTGDSAEHPTSAEADDPGQA